MGGERIRFLDGLKGLACVFVMWHHFILGFLPECFYGISVSDNYSSKFLQKMAQSPVSVIINGNYMVAIFCVVSGIVLSYQVMSMPEKKNVGKNCMKRYPRLVFPMVPIAFIVWVLSNTGAFFHMKAAEITGSPWLASYYTEKISVGTMLRSLFYSTWFVGYDATLSNAYWIMNQIFIYSFLVIILSCISCKANKYAVFIFCVICAILYRNDFGLAFVLGFLIAYMSCYMKEFFGHKLLGVFACLVGLILGGYPSSGVALENGYQFINYLPTFFQNYQLLHIIGAVCLIYGIYNIVFLQKILERKCIQILGNISYSIYLIHIPLLYSVSTYSFLLLWDTGISYIICVVITFLISNIVVLGCAILYNRYIETACGKIVNRIVNMVYTAE